MTVHEKADASNTVRRWTDLAADPMDPTAIHHRRHLLRAARRTPVSDRVDYLCSLAAGRAVLDIGVVDHSLANGRQERWLHGELAAVARTCLGVDILADEIAKLRERDYNVTAIDITTESLEDRFDLVVCGEVVEHVGNPGVMFAAIRELLRPGGRFVVTTPNPYAIRRIFQHLRDRPYENVDHVALISPWGVVELAERAGLVLAAYRGVLYGPADGKAGYLRRSWLRALLPISSEAACETLIYEMVLGSGVNILKL